MTTDSKPSLRQPILWALQLVAKTAPTQAAAHCALIIAGATLPVVMLWAIGLLVDQTLHSAFQQHLPLAQLLPTLALLGTLLFLNSATSLLNENVTTRLNIRVRQSLTQTICRHAAQIELTQALSPTLQTAAFRANNGLADRPATMFTTATALTQSALSLLALSACLAGAAWWMPLAVLTAGAPIILTRLHATRQAYHTHASLAEQDRINAYCNRIITSAEYKPELQLFALDAHFAPILLSGQELADSTRLHTQTRNTLLQTLGLLATSALILATFLATIILVTSGGASVGALATYLMAIRRADASARDLARRLSTLSRQALATDAAQQYLQSTQNSQPRTANFPSQFSQITLQDLSFSYPGSQRQALRDVSCAIPRGQITAIIGDNGTGKTTIALILAGLLRPTSGHALIGDTEAASISTPQLQSHVSALLQDFRVYRATVRQNIAFGAPGHQASDQQVMQAAQMVGLHDLIASLPDGYDTLLGPSFPGSEMFSRGEWQRLALARTILSPADIIILDEPNSALDQNAQQLLTKTIQHLNQQGKTIIIIAHNPQLTAIAHHTIHLSH